MSWVESLSLVKELRRQLAIREQELAEARKDIRALTDSVASSKPMLVPFAQRMNPSGDWAAARRVSVAREIQELERKHSSGSEDE